MTSYVKSTNFASKDSLASGNPLKIIKGTEIDTEFNNIATAVATKSDINSPTFTGTPAAPTASAGTNTTQLATTAFVHNEIMAAVYPVGSLYLNATNATNPATLLGFGTWVAFGAGRMPVGFNAADPLFDTAEETGGSKDATLVSHDHYGTTQTAGNHYHSLSQGRGFGAVFGASEGVGFGEFALETGRGSNEWTNSTETAGNHQHDFTTSLSGSSATNANLPPYITVYMWKRTA